jgi:hypothetical protein
MPQIIFDLTDLETTILKHIALNPLDYIENICHWQANMAIDEIVQMEMARMLADPSIETIPSDRNQIVMNANIQLAAEREQG